MSQEHESFLDIDLEGVPELTLLDDNTEVEVKCFSAEVKESQATPGSMYISLGLEVVGIPTAANIYHMLFLPKQDDEEKKKLNKLRSLKGAAEIFGVSFGASGIDVAEFVGNSAWAIVGVEQSEEYGDKNKIKRFIRGA